MKKYKELVVIILASILVSGCQGGQATPKETAVAATPIVAEAVEAVSSVLPEEVKVATPEVEETANLETPIEEEASKAEQFKNLEEAGDLVFNIGEKQKDTLVKFLPGGSEETLQIKAQADEKASIEMMYQEKMYHFEHVENIYYVDLDQSDEEKELVITGVGDGGNPCTQILKATSEGLVVLREIDDNVKVDQKGRILQSLSEITFAPEPIIGMVYHLKGNSMKKEIIFDQPKCFTLEKEVTVDFTPEDKEKESGIQKFKAGTTFNVTSYLGNFLWQAEINGVKGKMCLKIAG